MRIYSKFNFVLYIILVFTVSVVTVSAQNINSLLHKLEKTQDPLEQISIYIKIGNSLRYSYPDSAMSYYRKSLIISKTNKYAVSEAELLSNIGTVYAIKNNFDSAIFKINKGLDIYKELKNESGIARAYNSLGLVFLRKDNLKESKDYLSKALQMGLELNDSILLAKTYNNLGLVFKRRHDFDSALYFYHESLKIKELIGDERGIGSTVNNIALIYEKISEFQLALDYLDQSYKIRKKLNNKYGVAIVLNNFGLVYESQGEFKLALKYYNKSLKIMQELNKTARIATLHNNIGSVYVKQKSYKKGFYHLQKGLEINKKMGSTRGQLNSILDIAQFYENLKIYQNAINEYNKALALSELVEDIALRSEIFEGLYNSYEKNSKYDSALFYYKIYAQLNDSIFNTYSRRNIEKLEVEYQTLKKEKENQDLILQNQIKEEKVKRLLLMGGILLVILASIIVFSLFSIKSKNKLEKTYKLVLEQRNSIQTQSIQLKSAYQKLQELSNFKEELTSMIVHDLKNPLNVILNVTKINNYPDKEHVILQSGKQMLNLVMNILDVYKYEGKSFELEPKNQFINPLIAKIIAEMSFILSERSVKITTNIDYDFMVKIDENAFERIVVNLLTNAIKFSPQGGVIQINTEPIKDNKFRLHVIDEGDGIASKNIEKIFMKFEQREKRKLGLPGSTGIGLTYCKMAIEAHGGKIGVESDLGKGADFYIELDYSETKNSELIEPESKSNYLLLSRENRRILYPHIVALQEKDIYEVTDIRNILKQISKQNIELKKFCVLIEGSVLNCNQIMYDELLELALSKQ